jgi:hypothetical protein
VRTKGYALENLLDYISKTQDEKTAEWLRKKLPEDIVPGSWYPLDAYFEILEELERLSGEKRGAISREVGRFKAQHAAQGPYRLFFIFASPRFLIKRAGAFWGFYHDWGTVRVGGHHDKGADFTIEHEEKIPDLYLHTIAGWVEKSLEIAGAKSPLVEFSPVEKGVEFRGSWE